MPRIAIVGGGPAGSALALELIARSVDPGDLVVYDRARFPRQKLCGGAITHRGTEVLGRLVGEPIGGSKTVAIQFRSSVGEIEVVERGGQWLFDRAVLDDQLLRAVKAAGVEVREEATVTDLSPGVDGWRVSVGESSETFDWVAGADGACGISRRASGLRGGRTGRLVEAVYEPVDAELDPDRLHFDFDPVLEGIPGYSWIFPYPKPDEASASRYWKIGIMDARGRISGRELRAWTDRFAERRGFRRVDDRIAGWPERYLDRRTRGHRRGLVLVGEAYGIDPLLGEGIAPALYHAEYVADRLRAALDRGQRTIGGFERGFRRTPEGHNLWFQDQLADRVYGSWGVRWVRVLFGLPRLRELAEAGGDDYGRLARRMPSLIGSLLSYVARRGLPSNQQPAGREALLCSTAS